MQCHKWAMVYSWRVEKCAHISVTLDSSLFTSDRPSHWTWAWIHSSLSEFSFSRTPSFTWEHNSSAFSRACFKWLWSGWFSGVFSIIYRQIRYISLSCYLQLECVHIISPVLLFLYFHQRQTICSKFLFFLDKQTWKIRDRLSLFVYRLKWMPACRASASVHCLLFWQKCANSSLMQKYIHACSTNLLNANIRFIILSFKSSIALFRMPSVRQQTEVRKTV